MECKNCGWVGDHTELVALPDDLEDNDFSHCPSCESGNVWDLENYDDEEE